MIGFWKIWFTGVLVGWGVAVPVGPINIEIARRTLHGGQRAGLLVGLGAVVGDCLWAIVTGLALVRFLHHPWVKNGLAIVGAVYLAYLSFLCIRGAMKSHTNVMGEDDRRKDIHYSLVGCFRTGFLMALFSPYNMAFWLVGVPAIAGTVSQNATHAILMICAGVFCGAFSWCIVFSSLVSFLGKVGKESWLKLADLAGGILLLGFAVRLVWKVFISGS